jgi:hypothetical protein
MPKGAPNKEEDKDLVHCQQIEHGRSLREAAEQSPTTYYLEPLSSKNVCPTTGKRFYYISRQFYKNKKNYYKIKNRAGCQEGVIAEEDSSLQRAKEEQALLDEDLSYYSSQRDLDDLSLSTTTTINSPVPMKKQSAKKTEAVVKKSPVISISIPDTTNIKMENKKYTSKFIVRAVTLATITPPLLTAVAILYSFY